MQPKQTQIYLVGEMAVGFCQRQKRNLQPLKSHLFMYSRHEVGVKVHHWALQLGSTLSFLSHKIHLGLELDFCQPKLLFSPFALRKSESLCLTGI